MDFGSILTGIGGGLLAVGVVLLVIAFTTSVFTGGASSTIKVAGVISGLVGIILIAVGAMASSRKKDKGVDNPPQLSQPGGYQNSNPGGTLTRNPNDGYRPNPGQLNPGQIPPPYGYPPDYNGGLNTGGNGGIQFQGQVNLTGTFTGTAVEQGNGAFGQSNLALESGSQQVAVYK